MKFPSFKTDRKRENPRLDFAVRKEHKSGMKKVTPFLAAALLVTGCAQHYDMVLTNGIRVTNVTKPVLNDDNATYTYKDVAGNVRHVSESRVLEIKPHSRHNADVSSNAR